MASNGWKMANLSTDFLNVWREQFPDVALPECFVKGALMALRTREPWGPQRDDLRWHISVRYGEIGFNGRVPDWEELVDAAHSLRPGVPFVIGVPTQNLWMSVHPHVLHLWETRDENMLHQWRENAGGGR